MYINLKQHTNNRHDDCFMKETTFNNIYVKLLMVNKYKKDKEGEGKEGL